MTVCFKNMDSTIYLDLSYALPHHTDLGFPDKTAQEQKSSTIRGLLQQLVFIQPAASEVSNMKKAGEGRDDFEMCHETELFINMPDKSKVRAHFSRPE